MTTIDKVPKKRRKRITILVTGEMYDLLTESAGDATISYLVRRYIKEGLAKDEEKRLK